MTARERLAYYCQRLPLAEIATTYRFPPTPQLCAQWAERSPDGFVFDLRAWSLLTGCPTLPDSLWPDLQGEVRVSKRDQRRLYPSHLSEEALAQCWARFRDSLAPLREAGRLGTVVLSYPTWFSPRPQAWQALEEARDHLQGIEVSVELRSPRWFEGSACDSTLEWLEDHDLGFVCLDGPRDPGATPRVVAATSGVAMVRLCGRRCEDGHPWTWPYRYSDDEITGWMPALRELASGAEEVHVLFDNRWNGDAVDNALTLLAMLGSDQQGPSGIGERMHDGSVVAHHPPT